MNNLKQIYNNPALTTNNPVLLALRADTTVEKANEFLDDSPAVQMRRRFQRPPQDEMIPAGGPPGHYQADLMMLADYGGVNNKMKMLLTVLNTATRYVYARPLPNKKAKTIQNAMNRIFDGTYYKDAVMNKGLIKIAPLTGMRILRVDGGTEFKKDLKSYLEEKGIRMEVSVEYRHNWLSRTNRFHRTLRKMIGDHFARKNTHRYVDVLQDIIQNYNNRPHRTLSEIHGISTTPKEAKAELVRAYELGVVRAGFVSMLNENAVEVGDKVRLLMRMTKKGETGKLNNKSQADVWSREVYDVVERKGSNMFKVDVPRGEIKFWPSYGLQIVRNVEQPSMGEVDNKQRVDIEQVRAMRDLDRELPPEERKENVIQQPVVWRTSNLGGVLPRTRRTQKPSKRLIDNVAYG